MTTNTAAAARIRFMQNLQALDLENLDAGLTAMSVEAANLFPMIEDKGVDGNAGGCRADRAALLAQSIFRVEGETPVLSLEQDILIDAEGRIVDGRNRTAAIIRTYGLPVFDYAQADADEIGNAYMDALREKRGAMDLLKGAAGDESVAPAKWNDADLLFRHLKVSDASSHLDTVINRNLARRDMTTSQRACVAANVSGASFKRMLGSNGKITDAMIADSFGIGHKTMKRAKALKKSHKDLFAMCLAGDMSVGKAEQEAAKRANYAAEPAAKVAKADKSVEGVKGVKTVAKFGTVAIVAAITDTDNERGDVFDAILDGLRSRDDLTITAGQFAALEAALAGAMGVDLA